MLVRAAAALRRANVRLLSAASATVADYAVAPYRQIAGATTAQRKQWAAADELLHERMREHVPEALAHNGEESFDLHLVGVQSVLRSWNAPEHLTNAALFHSIYGTEGFQGFALPLSHREELAELIGERAERLAWIFCMVDRASVDATVFRWMNLSPHERDSISGGTIEPATFRSRAELGNFPIATKSHQEWLDFLTLSLADWLEQVEGAATKEVPRPVGDGILWKKGEAWAYRREAYAAMASILGGCGVEAAPKMHAEVYAREPEWSRSIHQPLTPPMGVAALAAAEALASARLDFANGQ